jgi:PAS domain S-box-containing protein
VDQRDNWHLTDDVTHESGPGDPFAAAVRATRMPMVITDPAKPDNPIIFCNEAFQKLTGYDRDEIVGRNCRFLQGPDTDRDAVRRIHEAIVAGKPIDVDLLN